MTHTMTRDENSRLLVLESALYGDVGPILSRLRITAGNPHEARFRELFTQAAAIAKPRAAWRECGVMNNDGASVSIDGTRFGSALLAENLCESGAAYPFIATAGAGIEEWAAGFGDVLERYWADEVAGLALEGAVLALMERLAAGEKEKIISMMNPGSLAEWPIEGQGALFGILGNEARELGVSLGTNFMMRPLKSISGIMYFSGKEFVNCSRCPREICGNRRAPFHLAT